MRVTIAAMFLAATLVTVAAADPVIRHVPVTTAVRGVPVSLACVVETPLAITQSIAQIRITDLGTPQDVDLRGDGKNAFEAIVPVTLIEGIHAFWYSLTVYDAAGEVTSTHWQRVRIVEAGAAQGAGWQERAVWIAGGTLAAGGAALAIVGSQNSHDNDEPPADTGAPAPTVKTKKSTASDDDQASPRPPPNLPCIITGSESVQYFGLSVFDESPIEIMVCNTCSNAVISATGSWGASDQIVGYNNPTCSSETQFLVLEEPNLRIPPPPGTYTIQVRSNGVLIDSRPWPDEELGQ